MTVRECYEKIGSDFDKVLERMGSEALVKRFAIKFLEDKSFEELTEKLRGRQTEGSEELYQKVAEVYEATVTVLKELENF